MMTRCDVLTDLIDQKLASRQSLKDDIQTLLQLDRHDFGAMSERVESSPLATLNQRIRQEQARLDYLEAEIYAVAQEITRHPLCLIPLQPSDDPFYQHLEMARLNLETDEYDEAYHQCQRASQLLSLRSNNYCSADRGLIYLFYAGLSLERGDYPDAQRLAARAYPYLAPEAHNPVRMIVRVIQGHSYASNGSNTYPKGRQAYEDATQRLRTLQQIAAERGRQRQAEFYRVLVENLQDRSMQLAPARVLEHPAHLDGESGANLIIFERQNGISTEEAAVVDGIAIRRKKPD